MTSRPISQVSAVKEKEMAARVILAEGSDYFLLDVTRIRVTSTGLYRIMEAHASGAEAVIQIDGRVVVEFDAAAGGFDP
jgi:hypothetical protein